MSNKPSHTPENTPENQSRRDFLRNMGLFALTIAGLGMATEAQANTLEELAEAARRAKENAAPKPAATPAAPKPAPKPATPKPTSATTPTGTPKPAASAITNPAEVEKMLKEWAIFKKENPDFDPTYVEPDMFEGWTKKDTLFATLGLGILVERIVNYIPAIRSKISERMKVKSATEEIQSSVEQNNVALAAIAKELKDAGVLTDEAIERIAEAAANTGNGEEAPASAANDDDD